MTVEIKSGCPPRVFAKALKRLPGNDAKESGDQTVLTYFYDSDWLSIDSVGGVVSLGILRAATKPGLEIQYSPITDRLLVSFDGGEHTISDASNSLRVVVTTSAEEPE